MIILKKDEKIEEKVDNKPKDKKNTAIIVTTIIIILLVILAGVGTYLFMYNKKATIKYENEIKEISKQNSMAIIDYKEEVGNNTTWTYEDLENKLIDKSKLAKGTEIKVTINDEVFKEGDTYTFVIGETKIDIYLNKTYTYKVFKEETEVIENKKEIVITIKDTVAPVIEGVKNQTITVGDTLDLLKGITAKDDVDGDVEVKSEGEVDTKKAGTYKVKIYAEDKSGNRAEQEMTVTVKKKATTTTKPSTSTTTKPSTGSSSSSGSSSGGTTSGCNATALKKRGYKSTDKDACEKDKQATEVAKQIANEIKAKGYIKDIDKVQAAASKVSEYYFKGIHKEKGDDYRTPYGVFIKNEASCAGCTRALILVLECLGFKNMTHVNANGWAHQWVKLTMDGQIGYADGQVGMVGVGEHPCVAEGTCELL